MVKKADKAHFYQMDRFSSEQLILTHRRVQAYAEAISGLPQSHTEVFEKRGWLLPFLFAYDDLLWGRWAYWHEILEKGTISGSGPIPKIKWANMQHDYEGVTFTRNMLTKCLNHHESTIDHFADWLLWGLSISKKPPRISDALNEHYYKTFDLFLIQNYPTDYLSQILCDETGRGYKSGLGYFPTPFSVAIMMTEIAAGGGDPEVLKRQSVMDPCIGCGALLLPASNYHLKGFGQDISHIAVKLAKIQMYWYAPWFAFHPNHLKGFNDDEPIMLIPSRDRDAIEGQLAFDLSFA